MTKTSVVILHDIRSVHNVGSIFRIADCAGVSKIYLSAATPQPNDRFGRPRKDMAKISLGAENSVEWEEYKSIDSLIKKLKAEGFFIIAIEQDENSVDYKKVKEKKIAFLFGTEVTGLPKSVLKKCDVIAEIPMKGEKESLNVSVAAGISIFRVLGI
jgi:23S rRNA (guanosine2251-2'-O)-methyltransferase